MERVYPHKRINRSKQLAGGFKDFLFLSLPGEMIKFD